MDVGYQYSSDIRDVVAGHRQSAVEGVPGFLGLPSRIHKRHAAPVFKRVDQHITQRVLRNRYRYRPKTRGYALDLGQNLGCPRIVLCDTGYLDQLAGEVRSVS